MTSMTDTDGGSDLIRAHARGRVLVPAAQRETLLDAFERSDQSAMAFGRQHGIKYPTFANWIHCRRKKAEELHRVVAPAFTEVIMDALPGAGDGTPLPEPLRISLGNGIHVDVVSCKHLPWAAELLPHLSTNRHALALRQPARLPRPRTLRHPQDFDSLHARLFQGREFHFSSRRLF